MDLGQDHVLHVIPEEDISVGRALGYRVEIIQILLELHGGFHVIFFAPLPQINSLDSHLKFLDPIIRINILQKYRTPQRSIRQEMEQCFFDPHQIPLDPFLLPHPYCPILSNPPSSVIQSFESTVIQ